MILAAEALAAGAVAVVAAAFAASHARRVLLERGRVPVRAIVAVALLAAFNLTLAVDELFWAYTRWQGMPPHLVNGWFPFILKMFSLCVLSPGVIWLYTRRYRWTAALMWPAGALLFSYLLSAWME